MLIFWFLTPYGSGIVLELKPVDGIQEIEGKAKLTIFFRFNMLQKRVKTQVKEKWAKAITLDTTTNRYKRSAKVICKNRGFEVSVQTFHQWYEREYGGNQERSGAPNGCFL